MSDIIKNIPYNNPSLLPIGDYDIEIRRLLDIEIPNNGNYGMEKEGNWSIVHKINIDEREIIYIDLVTLKKVLDKTSNYPEMDQDECASITQLRLDGDKLEVLGDVVKVTKNK